MLRDNERLKQIVSVKEIENEEIKDVLQSQK